MQVFVNFINEYGLIAMFIIIALEYACFPISSEFILPFSGVVAVTQGHTFWLVLFLSVIAGLIGTTFCFFLGYYGGNKVLQSIETRFPKTRNGIQGAYQKFHKWGPLAVCFGRVIPLCRTYIAFVAGSTRQDIRSYLIFSAVGITFWNTLLIGAGYFIGTGWDRFRPWEWLHIL